MAINKTLVFGIICLLLTVGVIPPSIAVYNNSNTIYVDDDNISGPWDGSIDHPYQFIQDGVDNANNGDTVFVFNGSYYENVIISESMSLVGEDKDTTFIYGDYDCCVFITADNCLLSNFYLRECLDGVIISYSSYNIVKDNIINNDFKTGNIVLSSLEEKSTSNVLVGSSTGIRLINASNNQVKGSNIFLVKFELQNDGILLEGLCFENIISGNEITNQGNSIATKSAYGSNHNLISNNYLHHNGCGINWNQGSYDEFTDNTIVHNRYNGIRLDGGYQSQSVDITGNNISYNGWWTSNKFHGGILLSCVNGGHYISNNVISYNTPSGIYTINEDKNIITNNNFIENGIGNHSERYWGNAYFYTDIFWLLKYNKWIGNYWSDYDGDGVFFVRGDMGVILFDIPWIRIDWNPAKTPYEI